MEITLNDLRSWHTVVVFAVFIGIVIWAWSGKRREDFNEAANLPMNEPEQPLADIKAENNKESTS